MKKRAQKRDPLSSKKNRETAATKKNPERFNARGFVSCASTRFSELGGGFGVGNAGAAQLGLVTCRLRTHWTNCNSIRP